MKVLLTGATGFLGRHIRQHAVDAGYRVVGISRVPQPAEPGVEWFCGRFDEVPLECIAGCDALIHAAAHGVVAGADDWQQCFDVNVLSSVRLIEKCSDAGVRSYVICGSCFEYGLSGELYERLPVTAPLMPISAYGVSKAAAGLASLAVAQQRGLCLTLARLFHVYGVGEAHTRFWPSLARAARCGDDFAMTSGTQIRDFVPVGYAARALLKLTDDAVKSNGVPKVINVGMGVPMTLRKFAETQWAELGATGNLLIGAIPDRAHELKRLVAEVDRE